MNHEVRYPAIGIRPVVDGRLGGVRESLEETTLQMAQNVARFFERRVKYPDGSPVQCIIPGHCIGRVPEAGACESLFKASNVGLSITVTPCWCYGIETIDMDPLRPKATWGFNGTERPGAVYLAAALAGHTQKGLPAFGIYGEDVQDAGDQTIPLDVQEKLLRFANTGLAVAIMKEYTYLAIGSVSMGIAGSIIDDHFFLDYLGMRNEYVDSTEIYRRIEQGIFDKEEYQHALAWTRKHCKEGEDMNPTGLRKSREEKDRDWEFVVKMTLVMRDLMVGNPWLRHMGFGEEALGHSAILAGFQGQRQWTDVFPNGDFSEAILNSSFDWNGRRAPYLMATENDALNGVVMLFGFLLTHTAQLFADVRTYWSPEAVQRVSGVVLEGRAAGGVIHMINSGSCALDGAGQQEIDGQPVIKPFYKTTGKEVEKCLEATRWHPAMREYFRGGGYSSKLLTRGEMPMTMARINLVKGLGPVLQVAEGWAIEIPDKVDAILQQRTNPTWPTTWFVPRTTGKGAFKDVYSVMSNWGANHCAISYGHIGADLITLAAQLRIPVAMHNVTAEKVFRPSSWASFGMDIEGADYRACQTYGPLYGFKR